MDLAATNPHGALTPPNTGNAAGDGCLHRPIDKTGIQGEREKKGASTPPSSLPHGFLAAGSCGGMAGEKVEGAWAAALVSAPTAREG